MKGEWYNKEAMKASIINEKGNLYINVDGEKVEPAAYMSYLEDNADYVGFQKAGYRLFCACVYMGDGYINEQSKLRIFNKPIWTARDEYDFTPVYESVRKIVGNAKEKAYVILRVNCNAPLWWREENPDERTRLSDGTTYMQSIFSRKWLADTKIFLQKLCAYLQEFEFSQNVIALQLAGMQTEEWLAVRTATGYLDYSAPAKKAFHAWLDEEYGQGVKKARFPTAEEISERHKMTDIYMEKCTALNDYLRFFNEGFARAIAQLCGHVKQITDGKMLVGVFYGYIGQLPCEFGHGAMSLLLYDENINFFASPFAYIDDRQTAKDWIYHGAMDSCRALNKLWFLEADVRTYKTRFLHETNPEFMTNEKTVEHYKNLVFVGPKTQEETLWVMLRSFAKVLISKHAFWWFDMWGGWYDSPKMMELVERARALYADDLQRRTRNISELAVVLDENASYTVSEEYHHLMFKQQLVELGFVGAPYDIYLSTDEEKLDRNKYKTILRLLPTDLLQRVNVLENQRDNMAKQDKFSAAEVAAELRKQGTHVFSEGNIVYANSRFVCLTAVKDGEIKLVMPSHCKLQAFTDGKTYQGKEFAFDFKVNQTELFEIIQ